MHVIIYKFNFKCIVLLYFELQARFILEKCSGKLTIENKKKKDMIAELQRKGFDSDPVKSWKKVMDKKAFLVSSMEIHFRNNAD